MKRGESFNDKAIFEGRCGFQNVGYKTRKTMQLFEGGWLVFVYS